MTNHSKWGEVQLRDVFFDDLAIFFDQQLDQEANRMAAFTAKDPTDRQAFDQKWQKIRADDNIVLKTIIYKNQVAGHILCHNWFGDMEISYWLGNKFWNRGIASKALLIFVNAVETRPLYAHAAMDNIASCRVLRRCGFHQIDETVGFAPARGCEIIEYIFELK